MPVQPPSPTGLGASASFDPTLGYRVTVAWDPSPDPTVNHYELGVSTDGGQSFQVQIVVPTHFVFTGQPQLTYLFQVRADNFFGDQSANSPAAAITPLGYIDTPTWSTNQSVPAPERALIDDHYYLASNPDVAAAGVDPAAHFTAYGWHDGRKPDALFDVAFYLAHNPDVAAAGMDPLLHYATQGWKEGRDPSAAFSTSSYLAANADIRLAGVDPLEHYLHYGHSEGRALA